MWEIPLTDYVGKSQKLKRLAAEKVWSELIGPLILSRLSTDLLERLGKIGAKSQHIEIAPKLEANPKSFRRAKNGFNR